MVTCSLSNEMGFVVFKTDDLMFINTQIYTYIHFPFNDLIWLIQSGQGLNGLLCRLSKHHVPT